MPDISKNCRSQNISDNVLWSCYIWFYYGDYSASGHSVCNLSESGASESHILHLVFLDQVCTSTPCLTAPGPSAPSRSSSGPSAPGSSESSPFSSGLSKFGYNIRYLYRRGTE